MDAYLAAAAGQPPGVPDPGGVFGLDASSTSEGASPVEGGPAGRTGALRPGLTLIGDKGFAGRDFEDLVTTGFSPRPVRPDRRDEAPRFGTIGWIRQWIESVNDTPQKAS